LGVVGSDGGEEGGDGDLGGMKSSEEGELRERTELL
jgi:hypothetical protein